MLRNARYAKEDSHSTFDWFKNYEQIRDLLTELIPEKDKSRILMLGCGNSSLSEDMYADGFKEIVNIDVRAFVISDTSAHEKTELRICCSCLRSTHLWSSRP
jgi:2-polyprenyl-3-methyl-5-hydroxy-6-metoxy-1,4-benzoquinol methylase